MSTFELGSRGMSIEDLAVFERSQGEIVIRAGGVFWRRVRRLFYRPLLAFEELCGRPRAPAAAVFGGCQYAVPFGGASNSVLKFLVFESPSGYSLETLDYNRKRQVKLAARQFVVRPITGVREFTEAAYPVYLAFQARTAYRYRADRRSPEGFARWADSIFRFPQNLVLGEYREGRLEGVSISRLVADTLFYSTFFCTDQALRLGGSDFMLHTVREAAAGCPGVKQIVAGMHHGGKGIDDFYRLRGCRLVAKPAMLRLNPLTAWLLGRLRPGDYAKLRGVTEPDKPREKAGSAVPAAERSERKSMSHSRPEAGPRQSGWTGASSASAP